MALIIVSIGALALAVFFAVVAWRVTRQERLRSAVRVAALAEAIDEVTPASAPAPAAPVQPEFLAHERSASGHGLLKLAIGFAMAVALIVTIASLGSRRPDPASGSAAAATQNMALELLSMRHDREGDTLTVTGLVRNAGHGAAQRLTAVVFAFDKSGNFVASGRAPLDFVSLAPGDESPFRVSIPNVASVGRYRVSFRTEAGVVKHVDRRQALLAAAQ